MGSLRRPDLPQSRRQGHTSIFRVAESLNTRRTAEAVRFLEFLTSGAQDLYGSINYEYPVNPAVDTPKELRSWGTNSQMPIARIAELAPEAQKVIDRVGYCAETPLPHKATVVFKSVATGDGRLSRAFLSPVVAIVVTATGDSAGLVPSSGNCAAAVRREHADFDGGCRRLALLFGVSTAWIVFRYKFCGSRSLNGSCYRLPFPAI